MEKTLPSLPPRWALLLRVLAGLALLGGWVGACAGAAAEAPLAEALAAQARGFVQAQLAAPGLPRSEVFVGALDARLRLNPCNEVQVYLPNGAHLWGKTRVGLRCVKGVTPWNVYLPVTVNVYGPALVSTSTLPAGHVLAATDLRQAEVNLAEDMMNPPLNDTSLLVGRTLARSVDAGQSLRASALRARQWFAAGDQVQIRAAGSGFAVAGSGEAITAGLEGQSARVRTESGRVVSGMPVAERQLELAL